MGNEDKLLMAMLLAMGSYLPSLLLSALLAVVDFPNALPLAAPIFCAAGALIGWLRAEQVAAWLDS